MTIILKRSEGIEAMKKKMASMPQTTRFDPEKFCGKLKLNQTPMEIQAKLRQDWERYK